MRKQIFKVIEVSDNNNKLSTIYDIFMILIIVVSIVPLAFKSQTQLFIYIDKIAVTVFIIDYILRLITADYKLKKNGKLAFLLYPLTPMAIIDLLSILPSLNILSGGYRILKIFRLLRSFRVFRVFKLMRYSKSVIIIINVFKKQKSVLITVGLLSLAYILIAALVVFNVEPESFETFFDAIYWSTVSLTTVGYGDIYPVTTIGRLVAMISSIMGIAIVALPSGIITAGYLEEINNKH